MGEFFGGDALLDGEGAFSDYVRGVGTHHLHAEDHAGTRVANHFDETVRLTDGLGTSEGSEWELGYFDGDATIFGFRFLHTDRGNLRYCEDHVGYGTVI